MNPYVRIIHPSLLHALSGLIFLLMSGCTDQRVTFDKLNPWTPTDQTPARTVGLEMTYQLTPEAGTTQMKLLVALPRTVADRQRIVSRTFSQEPSRLFEDRGNEYAEWSFAGAAGPVTVSITHKIELFTYDLRTLQRRGAPPPPLEPHQLSAALIAERYIDLGDPVIQKLAAQIPSDEDDLVTLRRVFDLVLKHMKHSGYHPDDRGAVEAATTGHGDCTDYTDLLVALCRAKGLPALSVEGFVLDFHDTPKHNWAEVYVRRYGWIPLDPLHADQGAESFERMRPKYIRVSAERNDPNLSGFHYWIYRWWGKTVAGNDTYRMWRIATTPTPVPPAARENSKSPKAPESPGVPKSTATSPR